jgi:23S rRNA-/tRNA-specific pseudouridylate synthase
MPSVTDQPRILDELPGGILAVHKPAGWRVHPANADGTPDLVQWFEQQGLRGVRPGHRIDAPASGIVLCAAAPGARAHISDLLQSPDTEKVYLALVHGQTRRKGTVRRPLADARRGRPLPALTRYRTLEQLGPVSLVAVRIETGRKHQIRRHLQGIGHAIVGDRRHRPRRRRQSVPGAPDRLWLHARALVLPDGTSIEDALPAELLAHLDLLRQWLHASEE